MFIHIFMNKNNYVLNLPLNINLHHGSFDIIYIIFILTEDNDEELKFV